MRRPIANNSRPGQAIYDPSLGSGTSLIAAEMSGRVCCGLEFDPAYVDVVVRCWQRRARRSAGSSNYRSTAARACFTGRDAIHQAAGQSFDERAGSQQRNRGGSDRGTPASEIVQIREHGVALEAICSICTGSPIASNSATALKQSTIYWQFSTPSSVSRWYVGFMAQQFSSSQFAAAPGRRSSRLP